MKIKITADTSEDVFVVGLGSITPNTWVEISEKQEAHFKMANGQTIAQSGIEVQKESSKKKEDQ